MPFSARAGTRRSIGRTSAVGLVTCSIIASLVLEVTAPMIASNASSGDSMGNGMRARTTFAEDWAATKRTAFRQELYAWSVASSSSPFSKRSDRRMVLIPAVALVTSARSSASAPTNAPISDRDQSSRSSRSRARNRTG